MRIAIYIQSKKLGGTNTVVKNLINNWPNKNDDFFLLINKSKLNYNYYKKNIYFKKFNLTSLNIPTIEAVNYNIKYLDLLIKFIFFVPIFIYQFVFFFHYFKNKKFDRYLSINGGYPGGESCISSCLAWKIVEGSIPLLSIHNLAIPKRFSFFELNRMLIDLSIKYIQPKILVVSNAVKKSLQKRLGKIKIKIIFNGLNLDNSRKTVNIKKILKIRNNNKNIIMIGSFERRKGHDFLLDAFAKVKDKIKNVNLIICGGDENEYSKHLFKKIILNKNLKNSVFFYNKFLGSNVYNFMKFSDICAITSQEYESFCLIILEAWAAKIPVVSTKIGGTSEVITNYYDGFLINKNNYSKFSDVLIELLKDSKKRKIFGKRGYKSYLNKFTVNKMVKNYQKELI